MKKFARCLLLGVLAAGTASPQDLPRGQIVDDVACADNPAQHYALYLPSNFTLDRTWPVIRNPERQRLLEQISAASARW
jgi:hypothetical protein